MRTPIHRVAQALLGVLCIAVGGALTLRPFTSLGVLVVFVGACFLASGLSELWDARDGPRAPVAVAAGLGWLAAGAVVLAWPGITIHALAIVVGVSMLAGGVARLTGAIRNRAADRVTASLSGVASLVFGALALSWPDVTVLVIALLVGPSTIIFGAGRLFAATAPRRDRRTGRWTAQRKWPRWLRIAGAAGGVVLALALLGASAAIHRSRTSPGAFYTAPSKIPSRPGTLMRVEPFTSGIPAGAQAWRILYTTTRDEDVPAIASGVVIVSKHPPKGPRPVIAWAHGTTGVATACAPSLLASRLAPGVIPGLQQVIERGWILVATDYIGLGTTGSHPYLIGQGEARSVLDAVRAATRIRQLSVAPETVVWGHSQGGHAALWAGALAPTYAPDAHVLGVAAIAPASDLKGLVDTVKSTLEGKVIGSYILSAYSAIYPDVSFDRYVRPAARVVAREMARRCLDIPEAIPSVLTALASRQPLFAADPLNGSLGERLRQNTPTGMINVPLLIAQGLFDPLVTPAVQGQFVKERCAAGQSLEYRTYEGRDHLSIIAPGSPFVEDLLSWTEARFAGKPPPHGCQTPSPTGSGGG